MSENLEPMLNLMNSLPSLLKQNDSEYSKKSCDDSQIFELINHINDLNNRNLYETKTQIESPSENTSDHIEDYDDEDEENENNKLENCNNETIESKQIDAVLKPTRIPTAKQFLSNLKSQNINHSSNINNNQTKIPRIAKAIVRPASNLTTLPIDLTSSSVSSLSQSENDETKARLESSNRTPRYFIRATSGLNNNNSQIDNSIIASDSNRQVLKEKRTINKRGQSQSAVLTSKSSSNRSLSTTDSNYLLNESLINDANKKTVRYIIRHKPRDSQVKIFSQKLDFKNVGSKIGSLEKASYVPGGGSVVIETRALNWNAQAKIGSLEKAAHYTPSGGNVKIESQKLNWNAQAKIGSLEKANYQPGGGNVKIENRKLNFKEKARPKTDTGLILIETNSPNSFLSHSQFVSTEQMSF